MRSNVAVRWLSRLDGLMLVGLSVFVFNLVLGKDYWFYLNPKFKPLSLTSAVVLAGLGAFGLWRPLARWSWWRTGLFALVLALAVVSQAGVDRDMGGESLGQDNPSAPVETAPASRVKMGGKEYIRINAGELYDISGKHLQDKLGLNYAMRGFVRRLPELDKDQEFIIYRVALYCCFADTTAVGFKVKLPPGASLPKNAEWVVVYGQLTGLAGAGEKDEPAIPGAVFASISPYNLFQADRLESEPPLKTPFMYEWHEEEPYAY
jgi:uncharacterized repeat protein (TIGR03943 family)